MSTCNIIMLTCDLFMSTFKLTCKVDTSQDDLGNSHVNTIYVAC